MGISSHCINIYSTCFSGEGFYCVVILKAPQKFAAQELPCVHKYKWNTDDTDGTDKTDFYILRSSIVRVYPITGLGLLDMFSHFAKTTL